MLVSKLRRAKGKTHLLLALAWLACVVVVSFLPDSVKSDLHTKGSLHSWGHLFAFAVGGAALFRVSTQRTRQIGLLFFGLGTACCLEIAQHFVYQADIELMDILMDKSGIGLPALAIVLWRLSDLRGRLSLAPPKRLASGNLPRSRP